MNFDLTSAKLRLGIVDPTKDTLIGGVLNAAKSIAENYCDRLFDFATERATFTHPQGQSLSLPRYPLVSVTSVSVNNTGAVSDPATWHAINGAGLIQFHNIDLSRYDVVTVQYSGGYTQLPDDLLLALWRIFDAIWADIPGGGAAVGAAASGQAINSITIPDVGTIRYESSGASGGAGAGAAGGLIDNVTGALLSFYRREKC